MKNMLDNLAIIKKLDKSNQAELIGALGKQLEYGWKNTAPIKIPSSYIKTKNTTLCGMGGSAIGADMVTALPAEYIAQPIQVIRNYDLPKYINKDSLIIIISYSGNTEETISCLKQAQTKKAKIITMAKNGKVERAAKKYNYPFFKVPDAVIPRASLGYQAGSLINFLTKTKKLPSKLVKLKPTIKLIEKLNSKFTIETPTSKNFAKLAAHIVFESFPLVIGAGILEPAARRLKDQFNENGKHFGTFEFFPELNHNLGEGFSFPSYISKHLTVILLENDFDHPQIKKRFQVIKKLLKKKKINVFSIPSVGNNIWSQKFSQVLIGDWISYYLAILNNVDPSPVPNIEWTKKQLA